MFLAFVQHMSDSLFILLQEFLFVLGVSYLSIEQNIQNLIKFSTDHLIVHQMREMRRNECYLFKRIIVLFVLFFENASLDAHISLNFLEKQHLLSWFF